MFYADVISLFARKECQKIQKINENNIDEENLHTFRTNDWRKFNEIFKNNVSYGNIKNHKIEGLYPLSLSTYLSGKHRNHRGDQIDSAFALTRP